MASVEDLDPLLPESVQSVIDSSNSFWKSAQSLQGVLEKLPVTEDVFQLLEDTISALKNVSTPRRAANAF